MMTRAIIGGQMATSGSRMFLSGREAVAQNIVTRLKWFYGEAFLETRGGTPWWQSILGKSRGGERDAAIKKQILDTPGVTKMTAFNITGDGRSLIVTASVLTAYSGEAVSISVEM